MNYAEYKQKRKLDTMRECMGAWTGGPMDAPKFVGMIRRKLKERAIEFTPEEIHEFVTNYGVTIPVLADNICAFCNHESKRVEKKVLDAFPSGIPCCPSCYWKRRTE